MLVMVFTCISSQVILFCYPINSAINFLIVLPLDTCSYYQNFFFSGTTNTANLFNFFKNSPMTFYVL